MRPAPAGDSRVGAIVLAAGSAQRMGHLKQLARFEGEPLVVRAARAACDADFGRVVVVLGQSAEQLRPLLAGLPVSTVANPNWSNGMGTSIATGVAFLNDQLPEALGAAVLLADQPLLRGEHFAAMRELFVQNQPCVVAAEYQGTAGAPTIFPRQMFAELAGLTGDTGAKRLISQTVLPVHRYPLPEAGCDVDTPADLAAIGGAVQ